MKKEIEDKIRQTHINMANPKPKDESQKELFTPGPWTVINGNTLFPSVVMADVEVPKEDIGTLDLPHPSFVVNRSHDQKGNSIMANARLIAASPDMYRALKDAIERMDRARGILQEKNNGFWGVLDTTSLKEAIKKATPNK